jgi:tight adherence protein C
MIRSSAFLWVGLVAPTLASLAVMAALLAAGRIAGGPVVGRLRSARGGNAGTIWRSLRRKVARVGSSRWIGAIGGKDVLAKRLAMAGWAVSVDELLGTRALIGIAALGLGLAVPMLLPFSLALAAVGFTAPGFVLARAARRRRALVDAEVPQLLDLLAACSTAGLSALLALHRAADGVRGPLAGELARVLAMVELGARWRDELRALAERLDLIDLKRSVMAMSRTETLGTPLAETLRERADEVREERKAKAAEAARTAPVKMLFPLVFMILPAFLLLTVVPVLIATLRSIR